MTIPTTVGGFALDSIPEDALEKELARRRQTQCVGVSSSSPG
jgi:hypothetical protein